MLPKTVKRGNVSELFLQGQHNPDTKANKDIRKKGNYRPIPLVEMDLQLLNKILANRFPRPIRESYNMIKWDLTLGHRDG